MILNNKLIGYRIGFIYTIYIYKKKEQKNKEFVIPVWMNLSCDALAALPSSVFFFVEDEVDDDEDEDEQIGATKHTHIQIWIFLIR